MTDILGTALVTLTATIAVLAVMIEYYEREPKQEPSEEEPKLSEHYNLKENAPTVIELSAFAKDRAKELKATRLSRFEKEQKAYEEAMEKRNAQVEELRERLHDDLARRSYLSALKTWRSLVLIGNAPEPVKPEIETPTKEELKFSAGEDGERRLIDLMTDELDDRWTIIRGYKNRKGEIDCILVGPEGVFAFEVKSERGVFSRIRGEWFYDKLDRYGNVVELGVPLADKGGRGPDQQLNEPADELERFIRRRGVQTGIARVVVFSNPDAELGDVEGAKVDLVVTLRPGVLDAILEVSKGTLSPEQIKRIVELIQKDHAWHLGQKDKRTDGRSFRDLRRKKNKLSSLEG